MVVLEAAGLACEPPRPTHVLLNRELGVWRFLNRLPALLYAFDSMALGLGAGNNASANKLLVAKRPS